MYHGLYVGVNDYILRSNLRKQNAYMGQMFSDLSYLLTVGSTYNCNVHRVFMYLSNQLLKMTSLPTDKANMMTFAKWSSLWSVVCFGFFLFFTVDTRNRSLWQMLLWGNSSSLAVCELRYWVPEDKKAQDEWVRLPPHPAPVLFLCQRRSFSFILLRESSHCVLVFFFFFQKATNIDINKSCGLLDQTHSGRDVLITWTSPRSSGTFLSMCRTLSARSLPGIRGHFTYTYTPTAEDRGKKKKKEEVEEETTQYPVSVVYWEQLSAASKPIGLDQRRWKCDLIATFRLSAVNRGRKGQIMLFRIRALDWHQWLFLQAERALGHSSGTWTSSPTAQKKHSWAFWVGFLPCHEMS